MKAIRCLLGLVILATVFWSCQDDRMVPSFSPESLSGDYTGTYTFSEYDARGTLTRDDLQLIEFRILDTLYSMVLERSVPESSRVVRDYVGKFELIGSMVRLWYDSWGSTPSTPWPGSEFGYFELVETRDSLRLTEDETDHVSIRRVKRLELRRTN